MFQCPATDLFVAGAKYFGSDRRDPKFAYDTSFRANETPEGVLIVECSDFNQILIGSIVVLCGDEKPGVWGPAKGGCRKRTCPMYSHFSNQAKVSLSS